MSEPRLHHVQCLRGSHLHRVAFWEWGDPSHPRVLVCVHGLSRQGRDFDTLAQAMRGDYRVVAIDVAGRGHSDWLADPAGYQVPEYVADMITVLARLEGETVHWVGTSMGGLIGLGVASLAGSPIEKLVLNDVGPTIRYEAITRIGSYLGQPLSWPSEESAADYLRGISAGFGPHTREEWLALSRPMLRPDDGSGGGYKLHYDPSIALPFKAVTPAMAAAGEAMTWAAYDAIRCPVLLLRGADSDLLTAATAQTMTERGPKARVHEFEGVGHAPTLVAADQIAVVREFLLAS